MKLDWNIIKIDDVTRIISFDIENLTSKVKGIDALCQTIVKRILTAKGSNQFSSELGTNFFNLFGTINSNQIESVKEIIPILIDDLTSQIKNEQADSIISGISLDAEEILDNILLEAIDFDKIFGGWIITLKIITKTTSKLITVV